MGGGFAKPVPVPDDKKWMVGTWVSSDAALLLKAGNPMVERRYNETGTNPRPIYYADGQYNGLVAPDGDPNCVRLIIEKRGFVHYVHIRSPVGFATVVDMPITKWTDTQMFTAGGAPKLNFQKPAKGDRLIVNGVLLHRAPVMVTEKFGGPFRGVKVTRETPHVIGYKAPIIMQSKSIRREDCVMPRRAIFEDGQYDGGSVIPTADRARALQHKHAKHKHKHAKHAK